MLFSKYPWLCILCVAMLPFFEVRAAIPLGLSSVWSGQGLKLWQVCFFSFLGASIAAVIVLCTLKLCAKLSKKSKTISTMHFKLTNWLNKKFFKYNQTKNNKHLKMKKWWTLFLFTAMPIPMSGAWAAGLLAIFLNVSLLSGLSAIVLGNLVAVIVVSLFCTVFCEFVDMLLIMFVVFSVMWIIYYLLVLILSHKKHKVTQQN